MTARQRRKRKSRRREHSAGALAGRRLIAAGGFTAGATLALSGVAQAAPMTFTVSTHADTATASDCGVPTNTDCTLRDAVAAANANTPDADTIVFKSGLTGTITLGSQLTVTEDVAIDGPGAGQLAISGNNASRIFYLDTGADDVVTISGLTLTSGKTFGLNEGRLGGAIFDYQADLTVSDTVLSANVAAGTTATSSTGGFGGAICICHKSGGIAGTGGALTIHSSTLSGNSATTSGGAIYDDYSPVIIDRSTINGNTVPANGGGIAMFKPGGASTIQNSTFYGNSSGTDGGAVYSYDAPNPISLISTTVAGNNAEYGGGVYFRNFTNTGGIALRDSIVANNTAPTGPDLDGPFDSSFSLIKSTSGATVTESVAASDITGQNPLLGALTNNGGPTKTMAPQCGSPAIDHGKAIGIVEDQRADTRPVDLSDHPNSTATGADGSDIGAVELQSSPGAVCSSPGGGGGSPATPTATGERAAAKKHCKKKFPKGPKRKRCLKRAKRLPV